MLFRAFNRGAKPIAALAMALALVGCVSTPEITASQQLGFVAIGSAEGFREYRCTRSSCGGNEAIVSHRTETGGLFAPFVDAALDDPASRKELADEFFEELAGDQGIQLQTPRRRTIGGREAYTAAGSISDSSFTFPIYSVLIVTDKAAEVFLAVNDTASQSRQSTLALANARARSGL